MGRPTNLRNPVLKAELPRELLDLKRRVIEAVKRHNRYNWSNPLALGDAFGLLLVRALREAGDEPELTEDQRDKDYDRTVRTAPVRELLEDELKRLAALRVEPAPEPDAVDD